MDLDISTVRGFVEHKAFGDDRFSRYGELIKDIESIMSGNENVVYYFKNLFPSDRENGLEVYAFSMSIVVVGRYSYEKGFIMRVLWTKDISNIEFINNKRRFISNLIINFNNDKPIILDNQTDCDEDWGTGYLESIGNVFKLLVKEVK